MYELKIIANFASAHRLENYSGKCEHLHGHNWKVEVYVKTMELDESGLAIDFKELKSITNKVLEEMDHTYLNDLTYFKDKNPTSENIARYIFIRLSDDIKKHNDKVKLSKVTVWESDNACASYYE